MIALEIRLALERESIIQAKIAPCCRRPDTDWMSEDGRAS